ncbi:hypothetical protein P5706_34800 [Pseudomonas sp. ChxA]|uniref:hypothetical protein n=1 Tax=Pseudomonas TaxID=286 RepID=UPI0012B770DF|nr:MULTISPECIES: hypothetical protein [Pseudomonas]MBF6043019.1 hypothetical protein [Pseudomonas mucoides]MBX9407850.1 hypothetical protein [Pseudomonas baetica]MDL2189340.1 hypothetical protein [Pseudomonas sp. ChxA]NMX82513.1 hypothetical protein [Pseudomonas sp. WS 5503]
MKFKPNEDEVDQERLEKIVENLTVGDWDDSVIEKLRVCSCPCHVDGRNVMC